MTWHKTYGDTEGPLGFPMKDAAAKALEELLKGLEDRELHRIVTTKATAEVVEGERADVSWISTESVDREQEVVIASGMDDSHFTNNPIVTLNHNYWMPPIGRSLWRKKFKNEGVKAKTVYPERPESWEGEWDPDKALNLIRAGLMMGKSVGFLKLESHPPTEEEIRKRPEWAGVRRIITKWLLVEYACCWLPCNQDAITEAVGKSVVTTADLSLVGATLPPEEIIPHTPLAVYEEALKRAVANIDVNTMVERAFDLGYAKAKGRI